MKRGKGTLAGISVLFYSICLLALAAGCATDNNAEDNDGRSVDSLAGYWGTARRSMGGDCYPSTIEQDRTVWIREAGNNVGMAFFERANAGGDPEFGDWINCDRKGAECTVNSLTITTADQYITIPETIFSITGDNSIKGRVAANKVSSSGPCSFTIDIEVSRSASDRTNETPPPVVGLISDRDFVAGGQLFSQLAGLSHDYCPLYLYHDCDSGTVFDEGLCMCVYKE
ncbi:MAG: hypothetical protein HZB55_06685 [Deltaproteobacteria bacterium]|nr:hypothetical protein [Deltaproteobacteria bacterium]